MTTGCRLLETDFIHLVRIWAKLHSPKLAGASKYLYIIRRN